jgi:Family of unknown function (DUF6328)
MHPRLGVTQPERPHYRPGHARIDERRHPPPTISGRRRVGPTATVRWCGTPRCRTAPRSIDLFRARAQEKQRLLWRSNLFAISGVLLLAVAVVVSVLLVVDYLFQFLVASICAGLVAAVLVSAWLVQPIIQRGRLQLDELFDPDQPDG